VRSYLTNDTLVTLPTGYGKSLTYKLLPYLDPECVLLVVVPVDAIVFQELRKLGDKAILLKQETLKTFMPAIRSGEVKFIFTHPEATREKEVRKLLSTIDRKTFIIIDEAHCVEMWGEKFRPAFRMLGELRAVLKSNTMVALTATISPTMVSNLKGWLNMAKDFNYIAACPIRENLFLEVAERDPSTGKGKTAESSYQSALEAVLKELTDNPGMHAVIYCHLHWCQFGHKYCKRQMGDTFWVDSPDNVTVAQYHASLSAEVCITCGMLFL
jgi:superfamily II DNA helicase RecQ